MEPCQPTPLAVWSTARDVWETPETEGLFCEHWDVFSETWPTSGMTRNGTAYALPTSEPATDDGECSSSRTLPTPTVRDYKDNRITGSFVLVDDQSNNTVAAGMITRALGDGTEEDAGSVI